MSKQLGLLLNVILSQLAKDLKKSKDSSEQLRMSGMRTFAQNDRDISINSRKNMNIILMENVEKLGQVGDVVKVKNGYARNYLFPRQLGMPATISNIKRIEREKANRLAVFEAAKKEAQQKAESLSKVSLTIAVEVNDQEKLYGAVSETEILDALEAEGQKIDKKSLVLEKPVDDLGIFEIGVKLHPQVIAKIRLWVTKKS